MKSFANPSTPCKKSGNSEFMEWISSFGPALLSKYPTLSKESQLKLKSLYLISQRADISVDETLKSIKRCEQEYDSLAVRTSNQLCLLGLGDEEEFSCDTQKALQESAAIIANGNVGDGTNSGAVATLAVDFLAQVKCARQKINLLKDIKILQKKNKNLKEHLNFFENEYKMALEEASELQATLESSMADVNFDLSNMSKLSSTRAELDEQGVSSTISTQTILDTYDTYMALQKDINALEEKFKKYGELPPIVTEAVQIVAETRRRLETLSDELSKRLTAFH